jgi:hypothetical protein
MRALARSLAAVLGGVAGLAGCAVLAGLPGDYGLALDGGAGGAGGGFDGSANPEAGGDAYAPPPDAGGDAAVILDAGKDAPATLCGVSYCPCDAGYFCSDFDETDPFAPWKGQTVDPGCNVQADSLDSVSAPDSVLSTLGVDGGGHARLDYDLPVTAVPSDILFKEFLHTLNSPSGATGSITLLQVDASGNTCSFQLEAQSDGYHLNIYGTNCGSQGVGDHQIPNSPAFGEWSQVQLEIKSGTRPTVTVTFPATTGAVFTTPFALPAADKIALHVGAADLSPLEVRYDNVELHVQ